MEMSEMIYLENLPVETLAIYANESAELCESCGRLTVEHAIRCGRALLAAKSKVKHGEWLDWLKDHFNYSQPMASRYMDIANYSRANNLAEATSVRDALRLIAESPERQAKKQEREAKKQEQQPEKAEAPPRPLAPVTPAPPVSSGVIRHENLPSQPQRPEWLADPDELERPEEDDLPPLPKTNTHHTAANRRAPDARETDRIGLVSPDDPRELQDGAWYVWSEERNRLLPVTDEEILRRADEIRGQSVVEHAVTTTPVVDHKTASVSNKRFTPPTADEVSAYSDEINAGVDGQQFVDFYESKGWMIGKNKMKDWKAAVRTWKRSESQRGSKISTAVRSNRNWDEEIPEWKPTE